MMMGDMYWISQLNYFVFLISICLFVSCHGDLWWSLKFHSNCPQETTTFRCQTIKYVDEEKIREKARLLFVSCSESSFLSTSAQCSFWCYIGEVLQLICRQWQKSAVGADSAVFTQQPRAVTHRSCRQRTTTPIHPDFVPSVRWPPPRAPFPGISLSLEWKLATQKAPVPPRVEAQQTYAVGPKTGNHPRIESTGAKPAPSGALSWKKRS